MDYLETDLINHLVNYLESGHLVSTIDGVSVTWRYVAPVNRPWHGESWRPAGGGVAVTCGTCFAGVVMDATVEQRKALDSWLFSCYEEPLIQPAVVLAYGLI